VQTQGDMQGGMQEENKLVREVQEKGEVPVEIKSLVKAHTHYKLFNLNMFHIML
jgi:hypothetical protein